MVDRRSKLRISLLLASVLGCLLITSRVEAIQLTQVTFGVPQPDALSEYDPAWSPDGSRLAFTGDYYAAGAFEPWWFIGLVAVPNGVPSEFEAIVGRDHVYYNLHPAWSPDGSQIAFSGGYPSSGLWLASVATGASAQLINQLPASLAWSPDGTRIAFEVSGVIRSVDVAGGSISPLVPQTDAHNPAWSLDGAKLAYDSNGQIWELDLSTGVSHQITSGAGNHQHPTWSPDGHWLAFASGAGGGSDLWVIRSDGSNAMQLTSGPAIESQPAWSPDAQRIAFVIWSHNEGSHVWVASDLPTLPVAINPASWSSVKQLYR
jgi:TolB protein